MSEFSTWGIIGTFAGATIVTTAIIEFLKFKTWQHIPTRLVVYLIAALLLLAAQLFIAGLTWNTVALNLVNAFFVAAASMGTYEVAVKKLEKKVLTRQ